MKLSLRTVLAGLASLSGVAAVGACATDHAEAPVEAPPGVETVPTHDASADGDDGGAATDAACEACAPVDCTTTDFCVTNAPISPSVSLNAIWGSSATDLWIVGTRGTILRTDGSSFSAVDVSGDAGIDDQTIFFSLWGSASNDVWIGATGAPLHSSIPGEGGISPAWEVARGAVWDDTTATQGRVAAIWGSSKDALWLAGNASSRFDGFGSFWARGTEDDGETVWSAVDAYEGDNLTQPSIHALWGAGSDDVWAVGGAGQIFRYVPAADASALPRHWIAVDSSTTVPLDAVWGSSASDVWAAGGDGTLRHFTGDITGAFADVASPTTRALHGIGGTGPSDVWVVGDGGTILHWGGQKWSVATTGLAGGQAPDLFAVWASGPDDVWIGGAGVLLHRTAINRRQP